MNTYATEVHINNLARERFGDYVVQLTMHLTFNSNFIDPLDPGNCNDNLHTAVFACIIYHFFEIFYKFKCFRIFRKSLKIISRSIHVW